MKKLIEQLLVSSGYLQVCGSTTNLFGLADDRENYWIVSEGDPSIVVKNQSDLFNECTNVVVKPSFPKNANMLILWEVNSINDMVRIETHRAEEDPYFFKKHVLYYTRKEFDNISSALEVDDNESSLEISDIVINKVSDPDVFNAYKGLSRNDSWQALMYRIAIKCTFLSIRKDSTKNITDVQTIINRNISGSKRHNTLKLVENIVLNSELNKESSPDEFFDELVSKLGDAGHDI